MKIKNIQKISLMVGFLLLIYVISKIDFSKLNINSFNLDVKIILTVLLLIIFFFIVRTIRWWILLKGAGIRMSFTSVYVLTASSIALSVFTPAQSGDVMKLEFLKSKYGITRRRSISTFIMEKSQDIFLIGIVFIIFFIYKGKRLFHLNYTVTITTILFLLVIFFILIRISYKKFDFMKTALDSFESLLKKPKILAISFFTTLVIWTIDCLILVWLARIVNVHINFVTMFFILSATILFGLITLIPGAIGAMEVSLAVLATLLTNYPFSQTLLFGLIARLSTIIVFIFGYSHLFLIKRDKQSFKNISGKKI